MVFTVLFRNNLEGLNTRAALESKAVRNVVAKTVTALGRLADSKLGGLLRGVFTVPFWKSVLVTVSGAVNDKVGTARLWVPVGTVRLQIYSRYRPTGLSSGPASVLFCVSGV